MSTESPKTYFFWSGNALPDPPCYDQYTDDDYYDAFDDNDDYMITLIMVAIVMILMIMMII